MHTVLHGLHGKCIKRIPQHNKSNFPFIKFFTIQACRFAVSKLLNPNHFQTGDARQLPAWIQGVLRAAVIE